MASIKTFLIASAVAIGAFNVAHAADLDLPPPPQVEAPPPPVVSGWYLRGDVGVGFGQLSNFYSTDAPIVPGYSFEGAGLGRQVDIGGGRWLSGQQLGPLRRDRRIPDRDEILGD